MRIRMPENGGFFTKTMFLIDLCRSVRNMVLVKKPPFSGMRMRMVMMVLAMSMALSTLITRVRDKELVFFNLK